MHKNQKAAIQLKLSDYSLVNIRKSLHKLTGITQPEMAEKIDCSRSQITIHIEGIKATPEVQSRSEEIWQIPVEELFEKNAEY